MIPEKVIDDIRDRTDIAQVIGSLIDLKKAGRNFKALCPFHGEKTPSFIVSPEKQIYHCFGCGKGGNVFHFLMEFEGVSFVETVRRLGKELGIEVDRYITGGETREKLDPYYRAMEWAARYYSNVLKSSSAAQRALRYLRDREIDDDLIERFGLGFAPSGWDNFYRAATDAGISRDILSELNLIMRSRSGSGYRDYFRNRIIFPIATLSNRTVGLAGRVLDKAEPKYLNTMESPIYSKGRILYGLNHAKDHIRKSETAIIVEGYMDYLMLWRKGLTNLSAVCGTSLTEDQARLLARYANRVYIINDGDRAGMRAAVRAADQFLVEGVDAQIVVLPEGDDPDSYVRKKGADGLIEMMNAAPSYFEYLRAEADSGTRRTYRKGQVIKHLLETVSRVPDGVGRELYLQEISRLFEVPVGTLRSGLKEPKRSKRPAPPEKLHDSQREKFQKQVFRIGLDDNRYARMILDNLIEADIKGSLYRQYYKALDLALKNNIDIKSQDFIGSQSDPDLCNLASEIALMEAPPGPTDRFLADTLIWLKKAALKAEMSLMKKRLIELESQRKGERDREEVEIAEAYRKVARELKKLGLKEVNQPDGSR